jgi:hypothetical protein
MANTWEFKLYRKCNLPEVAEHANDMAVRKHMIMIENQNGGNET